MTGIKIRDLVFTYPDSKYPVLKNINLDFEPFSWTAIIGHNGSGKSTLARLIDGLLTPTAGSIEVDGIQVNESSLGKIHQQIGFVFQNPENQFVGATVADDVAFGLENRQVAQDKMEKKIDKALKMVGMTDYKNTAPISLSGGQKQRVALAGILALMPKIIILDEATSMLDPLARREILSLLQKLKNEYNLSIISITHDLKEMELADQIIVLNDSQVAQQGSPSEILKDKALLLEIGVGVPASQQLQELLSKRGIDIPNRYLNLEELKIWLKQQLQ
ncbi:energy-coupling factor transporter ATPase [Limosilactobacillus sp. BG-MG3-A]|uniref:Energy-coupling factor transporter ATPase n=1 Tax=Limosilactobacillus agrestis TaxID=2759748 RepID=A0A7W3YLR5_9LACO|nr:energy-coupling factor transporter ATPase [Limosilactobacillus agrestis]MBD5090917.1 energy-coupling factor transporter ATPase [Lactobacillus sp.]MBB1095537.1 energy-coupling factor transporter ATPase [Limosilactobacillus agrestis]MBB1098789.1 energy-coupling factor transporter ATPase [Limosilactobacillus agrestis]MCD7113586.1 energy-coupling factor transporter ATPase [Limosilactobacillus agrestis]MCD7120026.1 energy-coupling factor transporter ATPase [Limosilactobacillus agrestis]